MTRSVTSNTDTITLNGADLAKAVDQFVRRCHQDLAAGTRAYTLVSPAGPVAHFDVKLVTTFLPNEMIAGFAGLVEGDRLLRADDGDSSAGIWVVGVEGGTRANDADTYQKLVATPYVRSTATGRWYLLADLGITDLTSAAYNLLAEA